MTAQQIMQDSHLTRIRTLRDEVARLKAELAHVREERDSLRKHFALALLAAQDAERRSLTLERPFHFEDDASGATIDIYPAEGCEMQLTVDFNSKVLGVQRFKYDTTVDYATQIAPCRTFCFFHELEFLAGKGLIKGGDMDNAIVIVEHPVDDATLERMRGLFHAGHLEVNEGYLNNLQLHFPDEIVRHKMLDMIGDFALLGAPIKGTIIACKTGHRINTAVCKSLLLSNILKLS